MRCGSGCFTVFRRSLALVVVLLLCCGFAGCTAEKWNRYELYMGQSAEGGKVQVQSEQWDEFLQAEVTPQFSDGFTVYDADGYWGSGGVTYFEKSKVLMVLSPDKDAEKRIDAIAKAYKDRFKQETVLKMVMPARVEFN